MNTPAIASSHWQGQVAEVRGLFGSARRLHRPNLNLPMTPVLSIDSVTNADETHLIVRM